MSQTPVPDAPIRVHIGAKRLNGTVWGLSPLAALAAAVTSGSYAALIPLMFLLPITGVGLAASALRLGKPLDRGMIEAQ